MSETVAKERAFFADIIKDIVYLVLEGSSGSV